MIARQPRRGCVAESVNRPEQANIAGAGARSSGTFSNEGTGSTGSNRASSDKQRKIKKERRRKSCTRQAPFSMWLGQAAVRWNRRGFCIRLATRIPTSYERSDRGRALGIMASRQVGTYLKLTMWRVSLLFVISFLDKTTLVDSYQLGRVDPVKGREILRESRVCSLWRLRPRCPS